MMEAYEETGGNVIARRGSDPRPRPANTASSAVGESVGDGAFRITAMVEKPEAGHAPVQPLHLRPLHPAAGDLHLLGEKQRGAGGEIQLTDAMIRLAETQPFYGSRFAGRTFDCGARLGFLAANVAFALDRADLVDELAEEIRRLLAEAGK